MTNWQIYVGFLLTILSALVAIRGETWDSSQKKFRKRVTRTGWLALFVTVAGGLLALASAIGDRQRSELAARPIYTSLAQVALKSDEYLVLTRISANELDSRSAAASGILNLEV